MSEQQGSGKTDEKAKRKLYRQRLLTTITYLFLKRSKRYIPPVVRALAGIILVFFGILGFLPVLGFWMIPLGVALIASDLPPLGRWIRRKIWKRRRVHLRQRSCTETG